MWEGQDEQGAEGKDNQQQHVKGKIDGPSWKFDSHEYLHKMFAQKVLLAYTKALKS